jgi:membrane associated rhomboid family serine protease
MAFIPIKDYNPLQRIHFQAVTFALIGACVVAFLWQMSLPEAESIYIGGLIPAVLTGEVDADLPLPAELTIVTSMFLHGGFMHLVGNMLYLWIFGDNVEDALGHVRFVAFYLLCGAAAAGAQVLSDPASVIPMVGASGAISGVLGAYLVLHPRTQVLVMVFGRLMTRLSAFWVLGLWIGLQVVSAAAQPADVEGGTAWWAHIGGFIAGLVLVAPMRQKGVPLFDRDPVPGARGPGAAGRSRIPDSGSRG